MINSPKVKASAKTSISGSGTNANLQTFTPFTDASFINASLLQPMLHVNHLLLQFAGITDPLQTFSEHCRIVLQILVIAFKP